MKNQNNQLETIQALSSVDPFSLVNMVKVQIVSLNLDLARTQNDEIINHTANKIASHLHEKYSYFSIAELNNIFKKISTGELGKVFEISYNSFCGFLSSYMKLRQEFNRNKQNNSHDERFPWTCPNEKQRKIESFKSAYPDKNIHYTIYELVENFPEWCKNKIQDQSRVARIKENLKEKYSVNKPKYIVKK